MNNAETSSNFAVEPAQPITPKTAQQLQEELVRVGETLPTTLNSEAMLDYGPAFMLAFYGIARVHGDSESIESIERTLLNTVQLQTGDPIEQQKTIKEYSHVLAATDRNLAKDPEATLNKLREKANKDARSEPVPQVIPVSNKVETSSEQVSTETTDSANVTNHSSVHNAANRNVWHGPKRHTTVTPPKRKPRVASARPWTAAPFATRPARQEATVTPRPEVTQSTTQQPEVDPDNDNQTEKIDAFLRNNSALTFFDGENFNNAAFDNNIKDSGLSSDSVNKIEDAYKKQQAYVLTLLDNGGNINDEKINELVSGDAAAITRIRSYLGNVQAERDAQRSGNVSDNGENTISPSDKDADLSGRVVDENGRAIREDYVSPQLIEIAKKDLEEAGSTNEVILIGLGFTPHQADAYITKLQAQGSLSKTKDKPDINGDVRYYGYIPPEDSDSIIAAPKKAETTPEWRKEQYDKKFKEKEVEPYTFAEAVRLLRGVGDVKGDTLGKGDILDYVKGFTPELLEELLKYKFVERTKSKGAQGKVYKAIKRGTVAKRDNKLRDRIAEDGTLRRKTLFGRRQHANNEAVDDDYEQDYDDDYQVHDQDQYTPYSRQDSHATSPADELRTDEIKGLDFWENTAANLRQVESIGVNTIEGLLGWRDTEKSQQVIDWLYQSQVLVVVEDPIKHSSKLVTNPNLNDDDIAREIYSAGNDYDALIQSNRDRQ